MFINKWSNDWKLKQFKRVVILILLNYFQVLVRRSLRSSSSFLTTCFSFTSCLLFIYFLTSYNFLYTHRTPTDSMHVRSVCRDPQVSGMELLVKEVKEKKPLHLSQQAPLSVLQGSWIHLGTCWIWKEMLRYFYCLNHSWHYFLHPIQLLSLTRLTEHVMCYMYGCGNFLGNCGV